MNCLPPVLLPQRGGGAAAVAVLEGWGVGGGAAPGRSGAEQSPLATGSLPTSETSDVRLLSRSSRAEHNLQLRFVPHNLRASQTFFSTNTTSSLQQNTHPILPEEFSVGFLQLFYCTEDL